MTTLRSDSLPPFRTRLHKFLASAGVASRRQCEQLMLEGRVTVDGEEIRDLAYHVEPGRQVVKVDGSRVHEQPKHYYIINKPTGYICTHDDPGGRPKAIDLCPVQGLALFTIGRLDEDSEGLLLVTNDGQLAEKLAHPRLKAERVYRVQVSGVPNYDTLQALKQGQYFEEGKFRFHRVKVLKGGTRSALLEVVLTEGKNREIRRLLARFGHKVQQLQRISFGPIRLGGLPVGEFRVLGAKELVELKSFVSGRRRPKPPLAGAPRPVSAAGTGEDRPRRPRVGAGGPPGASGERRPRRPAQGGAAQGDRPRGRRTYGAARGQSGQGEGYAEGQGQGERRPYEGQSQEGRRPAGRRPGGSQVGGRPGGARPGGARPQGRRPAGTQNGGYGGQGERSGGARRPAGRGSAQGGAVGRGGANRGGASRGNQSGQPHQKPPFRKRRPEGNGPAQGGKPRDAEPTDE